VGEGQIKNVEILAIVGTKYPVDGLKKNIYYILDDYLEKYPGMEIVSGGCRLVDTITSKFALDRKLKVTIFLPTTIERNPYLSETIQTLRRIPREWIIEQIEYTNTNLFKDPNRFS